MTQRLLLAAAAACTLAPASPLALAQDLRHTPILPGYWESTDTVTSPIRQAKTSRKCITRDQIQSYLTGPVNNHYRCHYTDQKIGKSEFSMSGDCVDSSGIPAKVAMQGVYSETSFSVNARVRLMIGGLPIPVNASTDAHRISAECPAPGDSAPADAAPPPSDLPASSSPPPGP